MLVGEKDSLLRTMKKEMTEFADLTPYDQETNSSEKCIVVIIRPEVTKIRWKRIEFVYVNISMNYISLRLS